jgi:hypothetical protein
MEGRIFRETRFHVPAGTGLLMAFCLAAYAAAAAWACSGASRPPASPAAPSSPTSPSGPGPAGQAPTLTTAHPGWKNPRCNVCHQVPVARHQATDASLCAQCHGANGACDPNGRSGVRSHAYTDDCTTCHGQKHQFTAAAECVRCHFASSGRVSCPGPAGPSLPGSLQSGCFGWPGSEFSPSNKASVRTVVGAGQPAVDFALRDTTGTIVRLSDLLRTKPVLLVHGAFT